MHKPLNLLLLLLVLEKTASQLQILYISTQNTSSLYSSSNYNGSISSPFPNILSAVSFATSLSTLCLLDGIFSGPENTNIIISNKNLMITSLNGPSYTQIDCSSNATAFYLRSTNVSMSNILIKNCVKSTNGIADDQSSGGAISITNGRLTITNVEVLNSEARFGGALVCFNSYCQLFSSVFLNNSARKDGGAIYGSNSQVNIFSNSIIGNNSAVHQGGGIYTHQANIYIYYIYIL